MFQTLVWSICMLICSCFCHFWSAPNIEVTYPKICIPKIHNTSTTTNLNMQKLMCSHACWLDPSSFPKKHNSRPTNIFNKSTHFPKDESKYPKTHCLRYPKNTMCYLKAYVKISRYWNDESTYPKHTLSTSSNKHNLMSNHIPKNMRKYPKLAFGYPKTHCVRFPHNTNKYPLFYKLSQWGGYSPRIKPQLIFRSGGEPPRD